jgi:hypothetical protein
MADENQAGNEQKKADEQKELEKRLKESEKRQEEARKSAEESQKKSAEQAAKPAANENLEQKVASEQTIFEKMFTSTAMGVIRFARPFYTAGWMAGGSLLAYSLAGIGPFVLATGMSMGRYLINKKNGIPYSFASARQEFGKSLILGTAVYPLNMAVNADPSVAGKLLRFLGITVPAWVGIDEFLSYTINKYQKPSALLKDVRERNLVSVVSDSVSHTITEGPKVLWNWWTNPPLALPILSSINWTMRPEFYGLQSGQEMPIKYGISAVTATGYNYFKLKFQHERGNKGGGQGSSQRGQAQQPSNVYQLPQPARQEEQPSMQYREAA